MIGKEVLIINMKQLILLFLILSSIEISSQDCTEIYLIRHAEKDRSDIKSRNPELNDLGKQRALKWVQVFKNIELDKIYSTNYNRTIQTVTPISEESNIDISIYSPSKINYEHFMSDNNGKKVLVVGHSNTMPFFVNGLINKESYDQIDDLNNSNLYVVTICNNDISHSLLYVN